jgi:hypothetical protein
MLLYKFPALPIGLHQDEMSEAYEAYSLLHTGADRWGYHLPVYFLSWGSGQNVLQSYLTIPVVAVLGLTRVSARLVPLLCGLLTLPLFFLVLRRWFNELVGLVGLMFLALSPWHIMLSRWGIENSPLPFFMLLGVYTFGRALQSASRWWILCSFLPFALALYTYGVVVVIVPLLLPLLLFIDLPAVRRQWRAWLGAFAVFGVASLPIAFFTFKNYVTNKNYGFERWLPFTVPLLPITRLAQVTPEKLEPTIIGHNLAFFHRGLVDDTNWFQIPGCPPIQTIVFYMAVIGLLIQLFFVVRLRRFQEPFLPWLLACVPACFLIPFNISRGIALFIPLLGLAAPTTVGVITGVCATYKKPVVRWLVIAVFAVLFLAPTLKFIHYYYWTRYSAMIESTFLPEMPEALKDVQQMAGPSMPIFVTDKVAIAHVQVLFLDDIPPAVFQHSGATWDHPDFGRFRFSRETLAASPLPYAFLIRAKEPAVCAAPAETKVVGQFLIGVCR